MKKLFLILMIVPLMMATSCKDSAKTGSNANTKEALLDQEIKASNAQLPAQMDYVLTLMTLYRDGDIVIYEYKFDEHKVSYDDMLVNQEKFRTQIKEGLVAESMPNSEFHAFLSLMRDTGKSLRYKYTGSLTGQEILFEFSNDEIKELMNNR